MVTIESTKRQKRKDNQIIFHFKNSIYLHVAAVVVVFVFAAAVVFVLVAAVVFVFVAVLFVVELTKKNLKKFNILNVAVLDD